MSIRLLFVFGASTWAACVSGRLTDVTGASIPKAPVALESQASLVSETFAAEDGNFRVCAESAGEYRVVAKMAGFHSRATPAFELRRDLEFGDVEMRVSLEDAICILRVPTKQSPDPHFVASGGVVKFTGRDGRRRKIAHQPNDRQYGLDSDWKRVVFLRGNEIWVDNRRVHTHNGYMWEPGFAPDGKSIRFWSTSWKEGDRQFTVPINGTGSRR